MLIFGGRNHPNILTYYTPSFDGIDSLSSNPNLSCYPPWN